MFITKYIRTYIRKEKKVYLIKSQISKGNIPRNLLFVTFHILPVGMQVDFLCYRRNFTHSGLSITPHSDIYIAFHTVSVYNLVLYLAAIEETGK